MSNGHESALSYLEAGTEFMRRGDWPSATQAFRAAIRLDPNLGTAHAGLGAALGNQGLWELAVEAHAHALTLAPDDVEVLYNLGVAYGELGRPAEAEGYYRRFFSA